jgi:hypothetical protein
MFAEECHRVAGLSWTARIGEGGGRVGTAIGGAPRFGAFQVGGGASVGVGANVIGGKDVRPLDVAFEIGGEFRGAESRTVLDAYVVGEEEGQIGGYCGLFGGFALDDDVEAEGASVLSLVET